MYENFPHHQDAQKVRRAPDGNFGQPVGPNEIGRQQMQARHDRGEVGVAMDDLEKAISSMVDDLRELSTRIDPALSSPPEDVPVGELKKGYSCHLARALQERIDMINIISRSMRELASRVQL